MRMQVGSANKQCLLDTNNADDNSPFPVLPCAHHKLIISHIFLSFNLVFIAIDIRESHYHPHIILVSVIAQGQIADKGQKCDTSSPGLSHVALPPPHTPG